MSVADLNKPITFKLSNKTASNRIYRSAQSEYAASWDEKDRSLCGIPLPRMVQIYQSLADGGAGLICSGNIPIHRDHMENEGNAVLDRDNTWDAIEAFKPCIAAAKSRGAIFLAQLQFPGRQVPDFINPAPRSSSDVALGPSMNKEFGKPTPLSVREIKDLQARYVWAAEVIARAGGDGVILHACHGYIISQFLSPRTNKRSDKYGGSLRNRARFLLELVESLKGVLPTSKYIIALKYNCHDFIENGFTFAESCVLMNWLEDRGVDFFDISGGTYESPAWRGNMMKEDADRPSRLQWGSYFLEWAQDMRKVLSRAVIGTTGGWRDADLMNAAVSQGRIDMCGIARPLALEPGLAKEVLSGTRRDFHL